MIRGEKLFKSFGSRELWGGLTFSIGRGTMVAVVGHSGAGKTTLLNSVGGLTKPDNGHVLVGGQNPSLLKRRERTMFFRESVAFLFQNSGLIDEWNVSQNLGLALEPMRLRPRDLNRHKRRALDRVGLDDALHRPIHQLSGGERQRVALARLTLQRGSVVLADEPSSALDNVNCGNLLSIFKERRDAGASLLVSTHDPRIIQACDVVLRVGALI